MEFIIKMDNGKFWGFGAYTKEYPNAKVYRNANRAIEDADYLVAKSQQGATVIANYGLDNECVECRIEKE